MTNVSTSQQLRRRRVQRHGSQSRYAPSGVMGISWWMAPNSCYSSSLAFTATHGLTRIETTHWTARCVVYLPILLWSDLSQLVTLPDSLVIVDYTVSHTGSIHDALAFQNTYIFKEHDHILAPNEWVWADTAYPIETWCIAPF